MYLFCSLPSAANIMLMDETGKKPRDNSVAIGISRGVARLMREVQGYPVAAVRGGGGGGGPAQGFGAEAAAAADAEESLALEEPGDYLDVS